MKKYTLDSLVREFLLEIGDTSGGRYARCYTIAISGFRELHFDVSGAPQTAYIDITNLDTFPVPSDYVKYIKIGALNGMGEIIALGQNDDLALNREVNSCGGPIDHPMPQTANGIGFIGWDGYADNFRNGEMTGRMFGIGGGNSPMGYYKFDAANGQFQLDHLNIGIDQIILEYLADLSLVDGDFPVHPFLIQTIKNWISWKLIANDKNVAVSQKDYAEHAYWKSYRTSVRRFSSNTFDEWVAAFRLSNKQSPRY